VVFDLAAATGPVILPGMIAAQGILTARGGKTSHAAVVARGMGKTCVCGADALEISDDAFTVDGRSARRHQAGRGARRVAAPVAGRLRETVHGDGRLPVTGTVRLILISGTPATGKPKPGM
jgi:hypothetical protein